MTQEEAAVAMHHAPISPEAPIPARVVPRPWEDLASYISRVSAEMGYKNPGWILHPEGVASAVQPYNLCRLRRKADYQFFEHLLCLNEGTIYDLTLHTSFRRFSIPTRRPKSALYALLKSQHTVVSTGVPYPSSCACATGSS